jgi:hypothetical protein
MNRIGRLNAHKGVYMYRIKIYQCNPNGTNDIEIVDQDDTPIDTLDEACFGVQMKGDYKFITAIAAMEYTATSPIDDGSRTVNFLKQYFTIEE